MHFVCVLNKDGGSLRTINLPLLVAEARAIFEAAGHTADLRVVSGHSLRQQLQDASNEAGADALLAGGGDGTISAAADVCFRTGKPLGVLPAGTMNLFARSLRMPLDLADAFRALANGTFGAVDIATANGRPFVHQFSVGMHTRLVRIREGLVYRSRVGKMLASARAIAASVSRPLRFEAEIRTSLGVERRTAMAISVSNNLLGQGHIPYADSLEDGVLGVYVVEPAAAAETLRLAVAVLVGNWKDYPAVTEHQVSRVSLRFPKRKSNAQAVIDGELITLDRQVDIEIHPLGLRVLRPEVPALAPVS